MRQFMTRFAVIELPRCAAEALERYFGPGTTRFRRLATTLATIPHNSYRTSPETIGALF